MLLYYSCSSYTISPCAGEDRVGRSVASSEHDTSYLDYQLVYSNTDLSSSCSEIAKLPKQNPRRASGVYWIRSSNGSAVQVYCDMDRVYGCNALEGGHVLSTST